MIIYTAIFVLTAVICIELSRCLMKNDNKDFKKEPYTDEKFVNIDEIVEAKCKALLDKQEENFRKRIEEIYKLNQMNIRNCNNHKTYSSLVNHSCQRWSTVLTALQLQG